MDSPLATMSCPCGRHQHVGVGMGGWAAITGSALEHSTISFWIDPDFEEAAPETGSNVAEWLCTLPAYRIAPWSPTIPASGLGIALQAILFLASEHHLPPVESKSISPLPAKRMQSPVLGGDEGVQLRLH